MIGRLAPLLFVLFASANARAQALPYQVEYRAPEACSSRDAFVRELVARTPRVRVTDTEPPTASFAVELYTGASTVIGHLTLREPNGTETRREVSGQTCEEVVPALALIAAVLVDPEAAGRKTEATEVPAVVPAPAAATPPEPAEPVQSAAPPPPARRRESTRTGIRVGGAAGGALETAATPDVALGAFIELSAEVEDLGARGPAFGIGIARVASPTQHLPEGDANFRLTAGRGSFCPASLPNRGLFGFAPCLALDLGELYATGENTDGDKEATVLWLAAGPLARVELRPVRQVSVYADGAAMFALTQPYHFRFDPATPVYSTNVVGASVRVGVRFFVQ